MINVINDEIKIFAQFQNDLCNISSNLEENQINKIIEKIPYDFLNQKDKLMMICQLLAYNTQTVSKNNQRNLIKLIKKILNPIKAQLQEEESFFWQVFKGQFYFKLWMHEEGLISIKYIIQEIRNDKTGKVALYFLPEIFEKEPEVYSREVKLFLNKEYSVEYIKEFKELRQKHFKWLCESNDFNDPSYLEIEKDPLRLSIKRDDIEGFQSIISQTNISINSKIKESLIESSSNLNDSELSLIDYAIQYGTVRIFKYLIMNNANISENSIQYSIYLNNYEIIHIIEEMKKEKFREKSLEFSIFLWKSELIEYSIDNYDYSYLDESEINEVNNQNILLLIDQAFESKNIIFLHKFIFPFFQKNEEFVKKNLHKIFYYSLYDYSCFFLTEFLKYPNINVNYYLEGEKSFLSQAIYIHNTKAIEKLLNFPNIDIYNAGSIIYIPFQLVCMQNCELKIVKMFCDIANFDINETGSEYRMAPFLITVINGNTYTMKYLIDRYQEIKESVSIKMIQFCFKNRKYLNAKILLIIYLSNHQDINVKEFLDNIKNQINISYKEDLIILNQILQEVKSIH